MIKITLFLALCLFFVVNALLVSACTSNSICDNARIGNGQQGRCLLDQLVTEFQRSPSSVSDIFFNCRDDGTSCCGDPCFSNPSTTAGCLATPESPNSVSPLCILMPATTTGYQCISKYKLCALNTFSNCNNNPLCEYSNTSATSGTCGLKLQYSASETQDFSLASCPALHGAVVAFLILMFISLVGAIIFVVIVVVIKQRKADEEEKKAAEEAALAEQAAKAQQEEQADF